ncbi:MAG: hypothetical protein IJ635_01355 [Bacteroidaceae bacterium]|nr:hypothetical protein [Bacteroidaceae bacterium]
MTKRKLKDGLKLEAFPEEITEDGIKIYGETSYENQMAVLSHYLHNEGSDESEERKAEIISAVREFLSRKQFQQGLQDEMSDEEVWRVTEDATQYDLFADFFFENVKGFAIHDRGRTFKTFLENIENIAA